MNPDPSLPANDSPAVPTNGIDPVHPPSPGVGNLIEGPGRIHSELAELRRELAGKDAELTREITARESAETALAIARQEGLELSRRAGMLEIASNLLHNVGNVLNSVNVCTDRISDRIRRLRPAGLVRVAAMLREHSGDLPEFLSTNPQGREIPGYLSVLVEQLSDPQKEILPELDLLRKGIDHIRDIVQLQLRYTGVGGVSEIVVVADLVEDAIRINVASFQRHDVQLIRHYLPVPAVPLEKSKVLQILVNLLSNGKHALEGSLKPDKILTVGINLLDRHTLRIVVADNGVGIPPENLARIFESGFTTRKGGHGFGLHSGATAATEMRGSLTAESDGVGQGAIFTLQLPFPFTEGIS